MISYAASILSASSRPDSIIFLASASSRAQSTVPSTPRVRPSSSSSPVFASEKHLDSCHISFCSHMTAPASCTGDAVERNACTTLDLRLISRLVRSWTLLVRRRFQCDGGKSRYARASGSASSRIAAPSGGTPPACRAPRGTWRSQVASHPQNTCEILPTWRLSCQEPASRMQSRGRLLERTEHPRTPPRRAAR